MNEDDPDRREPILDRARRGWQARALERAALIERMEHQPCDEGLPMPPTEGDE